VGSLPQASWAICRFAYGRSADNLVSGLPTGVRYSLAAAGTDPSSPAGLAFVEACGQAVLPRFSVKNAVSFSTEGPTYRSLS